MAEAALPGGRLRHAGLSVYDHGQDFLGHCRPADSGLWFPGDAAQLGTAVAADSCQGSGADPGNGAAVPGGVWNGTLAAHHTASPDLVSGRVQPQ